MLESQSVKMRPPNFYNIATRIRRGDVNATVLARVLIARAADLVSLSIFGCLKLDVLLSLKLILSRKPSWCCSFAVEVFLIVHHKEYLATVNGEGG